VADKAPARAVPPAAFLIPDSHTSSIPRGIRNGKIPERRRLPLDGFLRATLPGEETHGILLGRAGEPAGFAVYRRDLPDLGASNTGAIG
jgi:hypothetical protein